MNIFIALRGNEPKDSEMTHPINPRILLPYQTFTRSGALGDLFERAQSFGPSGLVVHGRSLADSGRLARLRSRQPKQMNVQYWPHEGNEPTLDQVEALLRFAERQTPLHWVAAVGGGSVIDLAKAAAGLVGAPRPVEEYHNAQAVYASGMAFIAVPTTAGTGSEATPATVLTNTATGEKKSFAHPDYVSRLVLLDAELLENCPKHVLASAGMDAFTQGVESYFSRNATRFTEAMSLLSVELIAEALPKMFQGYDAEQAEKLLTGSYLTGITLGNARLGLVHGLAHPLGARCHAPHGLVCALCLPAVLEFNRPVAEEKYRRLCALLGQDVIEQVRTWIGEFGLHSPFTADLLDDRPAITRETLASGSTQANPRDVTAEDVRAVLERVIAS
jgi:alcohol dehydrogenase class IV